MEKENSVVSTECEQTRASCLAEKNSKLLDCKNEYKQKVENLKETYQSTPDGEDKSRALEVYKEGFANAKQEYNNKTLEIKNHYAEIDKELKEKKEKSSLNSGMNIIHLKKMF